MLHGACHPFLDAHCRMLGLSQYRVQLVRSCVLGSSNLASSNWGCGTPHLQSGQQHSCWHHQLWWLHLDITVCTCCMRKYSQFRGLLTGETWQMFQSFQASWNTTRHGSFTNYYIYLNFYWGMVRSVHRTRKKKAIFLFLEQNLEVVVSHWLAMARMCGLPYLSFSSLLYNMLKSAKIWAEILNKLFDSLWCSAWSEWAQACVPEVNRGGH